MLRRTEVPSAASTSVRFAAAHASTTRTEVIRKDEVLSTMAMVAPMATVRLSKVAARMLRYDWNRR
eukprot:4569753-Prymnesium_polylepis.1